jgi:hypothetical protein
VIVTSRSHEIFKGLLCGVAGVTYGNLKFSVSAQILIRKAKNRYTWYGYTRLPQALQTMKVW